MAWEAALCPPGVPVRYGGDPAACARALVEAGAEGLVSWGCAGGLDPALAVGTVVMPTEVIDATGRRWATLAGASLPGLRLPLSTAPVVESPAVLTDRAAKRALHARTSAVAVDMESAAVMQVAHAHGLPALVIRVVLDAATTAVPEPWRRTIDENGELRPSAVMRAAVWPQYWPAAFRLAQGRRRVEASLAAVAALWPWTTDRLNASLTSPPIGG